MILEKVRAHEPVGDKNAQSDTELLQDHKRSSNARDTDFCHVLGDDHCEHADWDSSDRPAYEDHGDARGTGLNRTTQ